MTLGNTGGLHGEMHQCNVEVDTTHCSVWLVIHAQMSPKTGLLVSSILEGETELRIHSSCLLALYSISQCHGEAELGSSQQ